jgi:hypothetical protein
LFGPVSQTDIAKLMVTPANHVVAAFCFLNEDMALGASLPALEHLLEIGIAWSSMLRQFALLAELDSALGAFEASGHVDDALAFISGAQSLIGIVCCFFPSFCLVVPFFLKWRQSVVYVAVGVERSVAALLGAGDVVAGVNFVHAVGI